MKILKNLTLVLTIFASTYAMEEAPKIDEVHAEVTQVFEKFKKGRMPTADQMFFLQQKINSLEFQQLSDNERALRDVLQGEINLMQARIEFMAELEFRQPSFYW